MADSTDNQEKLSGDKEILRIARERFRLAEDAEQKIRALSLEDLEFRAGKQWPEDVFNDRSQDSRPCLTINKIPASVRQITNDQRQNRPSIKVFPVDDNADIETAKILQGMVRHIEYDSNADVAYDTAFEGAVIKGLGYFRIITQYSNPFSFEQEIKIKRIRNSFSVYFDPFSKEPDGADANWAFYFEDISKDDYKADHSSSELSQLDDWRALGDQNPGWFTEKSCRLGEYYYKEWKDTFIYQLSDGVVFEQSKLPKVLPPDVQIVAKRPTKIPVIKWCKFNAIEILEKADIPGQWIPIIPVIGDELDINGERVLEGIVRHAKDPQRMYNYMASTEAEAIGLAPRAPWIIADGQIPPEYETMWKNANKKSYAYLPYALTVGDNGQLAPPPQRLAIDTQTQAITQSRMMSSDDLKSTTGIHDAALGARSNETSGTAIANRAHQAQVSNFHLIDNLSRAIRHAGRIIIEWIPVVYDTARAVRILGENNEQEVVRINEMFKYQGESREFNLGTGKYDVAVETGPSFATKRQEAVEAMLSVSSAYPEIWKIAGDLLAKNMDWPGSSDLAERFKKTLPPGLAEEKNKKPISPEAQAMMQQQNEMIGALTEQVNQLTKEKETKLLDIESKERIAFKQMEVDLLRDQIKLHGNASNTMMGAEIKSLENRLSQVGMHEPIQEDLNGAGPLGAAMPNEQETIGAIP